MQYVISDTHLMDENLLGMDEFAPRPFATTAAMDQIIIDHWNARVKPTDVVYHLGDIAVDLHRPEKVVNAAIYERLMALNGRLVLLKGNHDRRSLFKYLAAHNVTVAGQAKFELHDVGKLIKYNHRQYYLTHYPLLLGIAPQIRNLHGHIHHYQLPYATNLNVGVDAPELNFLAQPVPFGTPLSMAEVETIAAKKATWLAAQQQGKE